MDLLRSSIKTSRRYAVAAAGVLALFLLTPLEASATASAVTPLVSAGSGLCMDVTGGDATPGTPVEVWVCKGNVNQQWQFTAAGELRTLNGTRCLDAYRQGTVAGTKVTSYTCNGQANQQWLYNSNGTITGVQSKLCLGVVAPGTAKGDGIALGACADGPTQQWKATATTAPDKQPPTTPTNLVLANITCSSATLSWTASTDNVGVAFYDIYHDGQLLTSVAGSATKAALTLTANVTWGLYVNARDAAGNVSQASTSLKTVVPACSVDTQAPTVPTKLQGTVAGTTATLTWTASTDNVGVTAYDIYRGSAKVGSTASTTFTDSGLATNTSYGYAVAARDAQGNVSAQSAVLTLTTGGACANPVCATNQVATETDIPWGLVPMPDGTVLYTRRDAHDLILLDPVKGTKTTVGTIADAQGTDGEGGLLGLAASPTFPAQDPWLYIYYTTATDNRIVRVKYAKGSIDTTTLQVLVSGILRNKFHNGGRLRYGPDGKLYATAGDAQNGANAQNVNNLNGKVLRLNIDGSVPSDNPFGNYVWSYGHRNPQGLAFDSQGRLWEQEFGNSTMDETNLIQKGGNYGWPNCEGTASQAGSGCGTAGYLPPKNTYPVANGSCSGIAIVRDVLYVACERGTRLYREVISGDSLTNVQQLFVGTYGRLRTVEPTIDGGLWLSTTNQGDKDSIANNSDEKIFKVILGN